MLSPEGCFQIIKRALANGGHYADIFLEETTATKINLDDGKINAINAGVIYGAGIRVIYGSNYAYAYLSDIDEAAIVELAGQIAAAVYHGRATDRTVVITPPALQSRQTICPVRFLPETVGLEEKISSVQRADAAARDYHPAIIQTSVNYFDQRQKVTIVTSEGRFVSDDRIRTRLWVQAVAEKKGQRETGIYDHGKSSGFELFADYTPETIGAEAARIAVTLLEADYAPQGTLPVVIDNGSGGVIFHEACGHALEATSVADEASVFAGKLGTKIAADCVTAIDDGSIQNEWGSATVDDEGTPTQKTVLIEKGILKSYLVDKLGSLKMKLPVTGNARRESYQFAPTSRMTNTYIVPGPYSTAELIASIKYGLYCKQMGGGSVNPPTSEFNFAVSEGYLIHNGKIDRPVKGALLIGKGCDILENIEMVADNLDWGSGMCGSISGDVPVNVGQAALKVKGLIIGGRNEG